MGADVGLDRFAQIRAEMESGVSRDDALLRAGLSADDWAAAQRRWLEGMGAEISRGRFELTHHYTTAFLERQRALTVARATPAEAGRLSPAASAPPEAPTAQRSSMPAQTLEAKPSYLAAPRVGRPPEVAIHMAADPAVGADASVARAPHHRRNEALATTGTIDNSVIRQALPFAKKPSAQPSEPIAAPSPPKEDVPVVPGQGKKLFAETTVADVSAIISALPFPNRASPPKDDTTPPTASVRVQRPPPALSGTSLALDVPKGPAVPFAPIAGERAAPRAPPAPPVKDASVSSVFAAPQEGLTVERYASLCVEMGMEGAVPAEIVARYGLTLERAAAIDAEWKSRMAAQPPLREAFDRAYATYRAWVLSTRAVTPKV